MAMIKRPVKQEPIAILPVINSDGTPMPVVPPPGTDSFWDVTLHGITQGSLALWASCPQKAYIKMKLGLGPRHTGGVSAMGFGDIFHRGLDEIYSLSKERGETILPEDVDDILEHIYVHDKEKLRKEMMPQSAYAGLEFMIGQARVLLQAYYDRWNRDFKDFEWVDLERAFEVRYKLTLDDGSVVEIPVRGKYDGVFRDPKGKLWLFETKTKGVVDDALIADKLNYDLQVMLYLWSMQQTYGETPMGVVYNIVKRPSIRQKVKETLPEFLERTRQEVDDKPDQHFIRFTATVLPSELKEWVDTDFAAMVRQFYTWTQGGANYRNSGNCQMFNRPCEFMRLCAYGDKTNLEKRKAVFPELEPVVPLGRGRAHD